MRRHGDELEAGESDLTLLHQLNARLRQAPSLVVAMSEILAVAIEACGMDRGHLQTLDLTVHRGHGAAFLDRYRGTPGDSTIIEDVTLAPGLPEREVIAGDGIRAWQTAPLVARQGGVLGTLALASAEPHRPSGRQRRLLDLLAWAAADFVERARVEDALRETESRQAFLLALSDRLRGISDPRQILVTAARALGEQLGASVGYAEAEADGRVVVERDWVGPGGISVVGRHGLDEYGVEAEVRAGHTVCVADVGQDPRRAGLVAFDRARCRAFVDVPVLRDGSLVGVLFASSPVPRVWLTAEVRLIEAVAERTRAALQGARAEAALRQSEAQYRTLFESIDEGFYLGEALLDESGRVVDVRCLDENPAAVRLLGKSARNLSLDATGPLRELWREMFDDVVRSGASRRLERHAVAGDRWMDFHVFRPINAGANRFAVVFRDVTERNRNEARVREARELIAMATDAAELGWGRWDVSTGATVWDERSRAIMGFHDDDEEAATFSGFLGRIHPDDRAAAESAIAGAIADGQTVDIEQRVLRGDGQVRRVRAVGRFLRDESGRPLHATGLIQDVTEQRQAEQTLRAAATASAFRAALEDALRPLGDAVAIRTEAGRMLAEQLGAGHADYVEGHLGMGPLLAREAREGRAVIVSDVQRDARLGLEEVAAHRTAGIGSFAVVPLIKDGVNRANMVVARGGVHLFGADELALIATTVERAGEAIERARALAALCESEARQAYLVRLGDALRPLANPLEVEGAAARLLGEQLGSSRAYYFECDEDFLVILRDYVRDGGPSMIGRYDLSDFPNVRSLLLNGRLFNASDLLTSPLFTADERQRFGDLPVRSAMAVPLVKEGKLVAGITVGQSSPRQWTPFEVSLVQETAERTWAAVERARAEAALAESTQALRRAHDQEVCLRQAAAQANQAKDEFLAMLGHELRNPLTPILATVELMRGRGRLQRERAVIERQARHLARMVDDLLDVTRIARGKVNLLCKRADLRALVGRAVEVVGPLLESKRLELDVAAGLTVDVDHDRIVQVLANLLGNAAKYSDGRVTVSAARVGRQAVLRVRDDGVGIDAELLPHVFDLFRQGAQSPARVQGGLGLGLAVVRNLVELHGGTVSATSDGPGRGSEFTVCLPLASARPARTEAPTVHRSAPIALAQRILLVDDNRDIADVLSLLLRRRGHEVEVAGDASTALKAALASRPTLALLDIGLPDMDGYQLARALRREKSLRGLRLIALTGYGQSSDRRRATSAGFSHHLTKPIDFDQLSALIELRAAPPRTSE